MTGLKLDKQCNNLRVVLVQGGQAANDASDGGARTAQRGSVKMSRFRNWKMMGIELAVAVFGFCVFAVTTMISGPEIPGIVGVIVGIGPLWLFQRELSGILIDSKTLSIPSRIRGMPVLSFRRRTVLLSDVHRLTSVRWCGFEVVKISGDFGSDILIFASRDQRRRFTALVRSVCPDATYRVRSGWY
jgi:hypothetical protein